MTVTTRRASCCQSRTCCGRRPSARGTATGARSSHTCGWSAVRGWSRGSRSCCAITPGSAFLSAGWRSSRRSCGPGARGVRTGERGRCGCGGLGPRSGWRLRARHQGVHLRDALGFVRARRTCPAGRKGAAKCVGSQARCNEVVSQTHCSRATLEGAWSVRRAFRPTIEGAGPWEAVDRASSGYARVPGAVQGIGHLADDQSREVEPQRGAARVRT